MNYRTYARLQEQVAEAVLPNGLRVRVLHKPEFEKVYGILAVNYGSADTDYLRDGVRVRTPAGVAHYLEHKMFDLPSGSAMAQFTALGGSPNAFTGYGMTAYYVQTTQNPEENLRLLLEMVLTPWFTKESVEKERGIIAQEIKMYADSPDACLFERLFEALYPAHPLSVPIAGSVESIQHIDAETLYECYDAFYRPENMILCVEGNLAPEQVLAVAESVPAKPSAGVIRPLLREMEAAEPLSGTHRSRMDVAMPMFAIAFPLPDTQPGDSMTEFAGDLAMELLVGESTQLYRQLYEAGLIDSGFSAGFEGIRGKAMLSVAGDSRDPQAVLEAICRHALELQADGICSADLERLKKGSLGRRIRDLDSFSGTCSRLCEAELEGTDSLSFPEFIQAVTPEDIQKLLKCVTPDLAVMTVIEPTEEETA